MEKLLWGAERLGISLKPRQEEQFRRFFRELTEANKRANLTRVVDWEEVQIRHFLDSLTVAQTLPPQTLDGGSVADIGTGAGFPGVPLKIAFPDMRLCLVESMAKKTAFLSHLISSLGLKDVEIYTSRAEELAHRADLREAFDAVFSRALARLNTLAELVLPFCRLGSLCVVQKQGDIREEMEEAERAIRILGGSLREVKRVSLDGLLKPRLLVVLEKVCPTPLQYPRRAGIPAKRPL